jgi:hypothetical protein
MQDTTVNGYQIRASAVFEIVVILKQGILMPTVVKEFGVPENGTLEECYKKAIGWANDN